MITSATGSTIQNLYRADGQKLRSIHTASSGIAVTTDYVANTVYQDGTLKMIRYDGGYATMSGSTPSYHFYLRDYLGSNRVVTSATGTVEQVIHYYPFGGEWADATNTDLQSFKYTGKELDKTSGLNLYDYGARHYDPSLCCWDTQDPKAEKYYWINGYCFCKNIPVRFIDPDGRSYSEFDENGNYLRTIKDNWWHNFLHGRTGRIVDGDGNVTQSFKFADSKNDVNDLKDGKINRVQFVQEREIKRMLSKGGVFTKENKTYNNDLSDRHSYIKKEGLGGGKLDFSVTGIPYQYEDVSQSLFLVDGVAHNHFNFGNFLFGAAGKALGLSVFELQMGAHYNSLLNPDINGYKRQLDSPDDQFSIRMGVKHANKNNYQKMFYQVVIGPLSK